MIEIPTSVHAEAPGGAPFFIDRCEFNPNGRIDYATLDLDESRVFDWPMVYILANDDAAYIGQTTSVATRMAQHGANEEKRDFRTVNIIYNEEFNASVVTDYEHRLIGLMHADGRYRLTNKNDGMTDTNYFSKARYAKMFEELWAELRKLELADHSIAEIEESEVFKYSPYKGLTPDQRIALDKIMLEVEKGFDVALPLVVEGMPGTGKTILAIYLLKLLRDKPEFNHMNIRIVEPVTSLRKTLQRTLANVSGLQPSDIIGPADVIKSSFGYKGNDEKAFDILLVDEAHRLKRRVNLGTQFKNYDDVNRTLGLDTEATQMDWIIAQAKLPIFFYDPLQSVGPSCIGAERVRDSLGEAVEEPIRLDSQMRVKGGKEYLDYVRDILSGGAPDFRTFDGYDYVLHDDFDDFVRSFEESIARHDLTRMVAGYAWKWRTKKDKGAGAYDIEIDGVRLRWNCTYENWVGKGADNPDIAREVGCIHSIQGYDLSYAYVIIGNDLCLDQDSCMCVANKKSYFDRNGYATATQEELDQYIRNIYYVLLTRGIFGTHVYVCDEALRERFKKFTRK